jgi:hypothetical protein
MELEIVCPLAARGKKVIGKLARKLVKVLSVSLGLEYIPTRISQRVKLK